MLNSFTVMLLVAHVCGDYTFQTPALAESKQRSPIGILVHGAIHAALLIGVYILALFTGAPAQVAIPLLLILAAHLVLDLFKRFTRTLLSTPTAYVVDQILHLLVILSVSEILFSDLTETMILTPDWRQALKGLLIFVLITKPANVSFKILFAKYQYVDPEVPSVAGAGAIIGTMERILSAIFIATGQLTAVGLIYTAKSIARFKQIETSRRFAEYYLIGTLYSILYTVLVTGIVARV